MSVSLPAKLLPNHLYLFFCNPEEIQDQQLINEYHLLLASDELKRKNRFQFPRHQHQFLLTRALLRTVLANYLNVSSQALHFNNNEFGKPEIDVGQQHREYLSFNVSHTDGYIILGICLSYIIGVDVENTLKVRKIMDIADHVFADSEKTALVNLGDSQMQRQRFFNLWTLKESYIKACGMGLSIPLDQFAFSFNKNHIDIGFYKGRQDCADYWQFALFKPTGGAHQAAFAVYGYNHKPNLTTKMFEVVPLVDTKPVEYKLEYYSHC